MSLMDERNVTDPNLAYIANEFRGKTFGKEFVVEHGFLYDKITIAAGGTLDETTSLWFHNVGAGTSKTLASTNLTTSRKLDAPQAFSVRAIRLMYKSDILRADLDTILNGYTFEIVIADAWKVRAPISMFPAGGGPTGATAAVVNNGLASSEAVRTLALPLLIESNASFYARLVGGSNLLTAGGSSGTGFTCYCILEGLHARPTVG